MTFTHIGRTALTQVEGSPSAAGTKRGETGAVTSRQSSSEIAAWLAARDPETVDRAAVLRASSRGVTLDMDKSGHATYDEKGNQTGFVTFARRCNVIGPAEARLAALDDVLKFCTPAPMRAIEGWLAELSVIVARRGDDEFGDELRLSAYASRLSKYPADIVRHVLLAQRWKWWPTWYEVEEICERMHSPRKHMILALNRSPQPPEPARRPATQDERDRAQQLVDELFPEISPAMRKAAVDEAMKGNCMRAESDV